MPRAWPAAAVMALVLALGAAPARAESALWTLVATPLTATVGTLATFSLAATNGDPLALHDTSREIGCIRLDVPSNFRVEGTAVTGATGVRSERWVSSRAGNRVTVRTTSGGDRLGLLDMVGFAVTAMPLSAGELAWTARAYRDQDCSGSGAVLGVPPVVLVVNPSVIPSPTPAPTPTATPAPPPTPAPTRLPARTASPSPTTAPRSTPAPTPSSDSSPRTVPPSPSESPSESIDESSPSPIADPSPDPTPGPAGPAPAPGEPPPGDGGVALGPARQVAEIVGELSATFDQAGGESASLGPLGVAGGVATWIVPGLILTVPGLLVIGFALLEGAGALAWLPAIRRLSGPEPEAG